MTEFWVAPKCSETAFNSFLDGDFRRNSFGITAEQLFLQGVPVRLSLRSWSMRLALNMYEASMPSGGAMEDPLFPISIRRYHPKEPIHFPPWKYYMPG